MAGTDTRIVVSDTSVLVNFLRIDRMDLIANVSYDVLATDHVGDEISDTYADQQVRYQAAQTDGIIYQVSLTDSQELEIFGALAASGRLGSGECSAIACAVHNGYALAIDDRLAAREAMKVSSGLEIIRTQDLIVEMINQKLLSIENADSIKMDWEQNHRFKLKIESFAELVN